MKNTTAWYCVVVRDSIGQKHKQTKQKPHSLLTFEGQRISSRYCYLR